MRYRCSWLMMLLLAAGFGAAHAQQRRTITGRVTDESGKPIPGAQVTIKGTNTGALGKQDGTYAVSAPASDITLVVQFIGYKRVEIPVAAARNSVNVSMKTDVLNLDEIVVTGQATGIQRRNLANAVAKVNAAELTKAPTATVSQALMGKVAGAQIYSNSGAPGGGVRVRLRGITSINGGAAPLYVVDGVVASDAAIAPGVNVVSKASTTSGVIAVESSETSVNRISDLNPNDIESVEVLKGAAASAIYGSKASNGVIIITTKRGKPGQVSYNIRQGVGTSQNSYKQGFRTFTTLADAVEQFGPTTAALWQPGVFYDHEAEMMGRTPFNYETALNVSGGTEITRYFASVSNKHEGGIVNGTYANKQDIRLNLDQQVGKKLTARLNAEILHNNNDRGLFNNDNSGASEYFAMSKIPSFLDIRKQANGTYYMPLFVASNPLQTADLFKNQETVWRSVASSNVDYTFVNSDVHSLKAILTGGADVFTQKNKVLSPSELFFEDDDGLLGTSGVSFSQNINVNLNANLVHSFKPKGGLLTATTSAGLQYESRSLDVSRVVGQGLLGATNFSVATVQTTQEARQDTRDLGFFGQEEVVLKEKLLLTVGIRGDRSSNDGDPSKYFYYPKAAASYRFPNLHKGGIDELKIRGAFGESGNQPLYGQKFTQLNTSIITGFGGFTLPGTAGASNIVPERQKEIEAGLDAALFDGRANLEVTGYQKNISDLLLQRTLPPSVGFSSAFSNGGALRVRGIEVVGTLSPFRGKFAWTSRINVAKNRAIITSLPVAPFFISSAQTGALHIQEGHSVTELWGNDTITGPHADIPGCTTTAPNAQCVYAHRIGDETPKFTMGLSNEFTFHGIRLYSLFDAQKGGMQAAGTWRHFDLGKNSVDYDVIEANGIRAGVNRTSNYRNVTAVYFQDISFIKLREATIGYDVPAGFMSLLRIPAKTMRLNLSGRDLLLFTHYRGGDPEYNTYYAGTAALQINRELMAYPSSRSVWFNVDLNF